MAAYTKTEVSFEEMVLANKPRLPITVTATEGVYTTFDEPEISNGDIIRLVNVQEKVTAEFYHPLLKDTVRVDVPTTYDGGFQTVLQRGPEHVYVSVKDIARDSPPLVRVLESFQIQGKMVKRGERLKLIRIEEAKDGNYLHCTRIPEEVKLILSFNMKGRFSPKGDDTIYSLNELMKRMPVLVRREKNIGFAIRNASNSIPGVPDDYYDTMLLTKNTMVEVERWNDPGSFGIYDYDTREIMYLPVNLPITVVPAEGTIAQYDPPEDLFDLAARHAELPLFALCCDGQKSLDYLDLPQGTIVVIHGTERRKGVICNGRSSNLLVPTEYKKTTLFKILGREFITPFELWDSKHTGIVKATETCKAPRGFPDSRSIYKNDEVRLFSKPTENEEVPKLVGCEGDIEEIDIIYLYRTMSTTSTILGPIFVPSYFKVYFREPAVSLGEHCLADIMTKFSSGKLPLVVEMNSITRGASMTKDDHTLMNESSLKIVTECDYTVAYVTIFDPHNRSSGRKEAKEIPDFMKIRVRPIRQSLQVTGDVMSFRKPTSKVFKLTPRQYIRLYDPEEAYYEDLKVPKSDPPLPPRLIEYPRYPGPVMPRHDPGTRYPQGGSTRTGLAPPVDMPLPISGAKSYKLSQPRTTEKLPSQLSSQQTPYMSLKEDDIERHPYESAIPEPPITKPATGGEIIRKRPPPDFPKVNSPTLKCLSPDNPRYSKFHLEPSLPNQKDTKTDENIPPVEPPSDGNVSEFDFLKLAGLFRCLDLDKQTVENCVRKQIDGVKLCDMFGSMKDEDLRLELALEQESDLFPIKHFVSMSQTAKSISKVSPPEDGNINHFSVRQIAGLMKYFESQDLAAVTNCLTKQIDGSKLCNMAAKYDVDDLKKQLAVKSKVFFALMYLINSSMKNNNDSLC